MTSTIIKRYDDLVAIGMLGLFKAAKTFDETKGFMFATYATKVIYFQIAMALRKFNREPLQVSLDSIVVCDKNEHDDMTIEDTLSDENGYIAFDTVEDMYDIQQLKKRLSFRDSQLIDCLLLGLTQIEISEKLNLSQAYVSRLIKKLRNNSYIKELKNVSSKSSERLANS